MRDQRIVGVLLIVIFALSSGIVLGRQDQGVTNDSFKRMIDDDQKRDWDFIAPTAEEKDAFISDDARRVELLKSYVQGETTYESVCADWDVTTNAHWGILGFSKTDGTVSIHFGRDMNSVRFEQRFGFKSIAVTARSEILGSCTDKPNNEGDMGFTSDQAYQCVLRFDDLVLSENGCSGVRVLGMEASRP